MTYPFTPHLPDRGSDGLSVHLLGQVDWPSAKALQERLAFDLSGRTDRHGFLLLCEHPPGVTVGREGSRADLRCDERDLRSRSMEMDWVARGGGVIVHSPGQLCAYPVLPVASRDDDENPLTPALLRDVLISAAAATCDDLRVPNEITPDGAAVAARTGVVAEVGAGVREGFSRWGLFLSVAPAMEFPRMAVRPDGARGGGAVSSLSAARHNPISMPAVRSCLIQRLSEGLGYDTVHTFTGHPLLRRTTRRTYVPA
ncbi:lipoyl protein ligase domain-containing protein [Alienimonas californiensis]|uniref:Octanoyltransferase n=1 Tax=Alienimonas californiensis TaxID=2527989 RepID=A0A517P8C2_9PLAN|nr:hypothetical protein [Alienimonas californiensis]QDT15613.1 Octanoyltransferase [Alienimonas californiensis]